MRNVIHLAITTILAGVMATNQGGCGHTADAVRAVEELSNPADDATLSRCRAEGRAVLKDGGPDLERRAWAAYDACMVDGGMRQ